MEESEKFSPPYRLNSIILLLSHGHLLSDIQADDKIIHSVRIEDADDIIVNLTPANFIFYNPERSDIMDSLINKTRGAKSYEALMKTVSYCLHKQ